MPQLCGKTVGPIGFGLMGLTWRADEIPDNETFPVMKAAIAKGATFWNGGEFYGPPDRNSLTLLKRYFTKYPEDADKVVLSIKGGVDVTTLKSDGSKAGLKRSIDNCLSMIGGTKKIDLFECARVDKSVPLEESMMALKAHVEAGDIGGISLSEVSAKTINAAAKLVKVEAVEIELSIFAPDVLENGAAKACADNGITMVAYSPLGRGLLTGRIKSRDDIPEGDFRLHLPRFQPGAIEQNVKFGEAIMALAKSKGHTPAQLALGWIMALSKQPGMPNIIPIPGATSEERVEENYTPVDLTDADMAEIRQLMEKYEVSGGRYPDGHPIEG